MALKFKLEKDSKLKVRKEAQSFKLEKGLNISSTQQRVNIDAFRKKTSQSKSDEIQHMERMELDGQNNILFINNKGLLVMSIALFGLFLI